jgi:hypothetical protein
MNFDDEEPTVVVTLTAAELKAMEAVLRPRSSTGPQASAAYLERIAEAALAERTRR